MARLLVRLVERMPPWAVAFCLNHWSPFRGAGIRVVAISKDFSSFDVELKLHWYNKDYVGVHYGGSIYSMVDPFYMLILSRKLGPDYIVWDKAGRVDYKKPGRGTIKARCAMTEMEINAVKMIVDKEEKYIFDQSVDILNEQGEVIATVVKTIY